MPSLLPPFPHLATSPFPPSLLLPSHFPFFSVDQPVRLVGHLAVTSFFLLFFIGALIFREGKKPRTVAVFIVSFAFLSSFFGTNSKFNIKYSPISRGFASALGTAHTHSRYKHTTTARRRSLNLLGCSPASRDHDTNFDRHETGVFSPC